MKKIIILFALLATLSCCGKKKKNTSGLPYNGAKESYYLELMVTSPEGAKIYRVWNNDRSHVINRLVVSADGKAVAIVEAH